MTVGVCSEFSSTAFQEFGLSQVFAQAQQSGNTYGYQIFKNPDCTGDPFGFQVKASGMLIGVCTPLTLPFVGNQADFAFYRACQACNINTTLAIPTGTGSPVTVATTVAAVTSTTTTTPPTTTTTPTVVLPTTAPAVDPYYIVMPSIDGYSFKGDLGTK